MRSKVVRIPALALLFCGAAMTTAQQPGAPGGSPSGMPGNPTKQKTPPEKSKLEEMLAEALKNNPDIRVAAAKLAEADAELNRTRLQVMQKVVTVYHAIETQKKTVSRWESEARRLRKEVERATVDPAVLAETENQLALAKGKLEELEAQLPTLLGKSGRAEPDGAHDTALLSALDAIVRQHESFADQNRKSNAFAQRMRQQNAAGPMVERIRKALQTPVKVDYKDMTFDAILKDLAKKVEGLSFRNIVYLSNSSIEKTKINLRFEEALPVAAILQALEDETRCSFIVRDYGILATTGSNLPDGALTVKEFLRQKPADEPRRQSSSGKNPPAKGVDGVVESVDASGLMTISIGSDAGLAKGHTLELFRVNPSKYLGTIRILEAGTKESIAQGVGGFADTPKIGDRVASHILGK